jgi:hypothetical protein
MRAILLPLAPLLAAATVAPTPAIAPHVGDNLANPSEAPGKNCRGRLETVRQERGLPKLDRKDTGTSDPLLILAVDRRMDGCEVLVMRNNANDVRPLPEFSDHATMKPAH